MSEKKNIFRKSSLDRMSSPDRLNDYIKVSNPGVWMIIAAFIILLIAASIWACTFELEAGGLRPIDFLIN